MEVARAMAVLYKCCLLVMSKTEKRGGRMEGWREGLDGMDGMVCFVGYD